MATTFLWASSTACVLAVGVQFIRPEITNPPVVAEILAPPEVKHILRASCYDCHSNETKLAWFDQVVPAYWLVKKDVEVARRHLNFSEVGALPAAVQKGILFESVNEIQLGAMPLPSYVRMHPSARVAPEALVTLRAYLNPGRQQGPGRGVDARVAAPAAGGPRDVKPAPNGIAFLPDYKNWKTISVSDRFDNDTIREILGNDVAVKAIAANHINPWPDGTAFAKVAWTKQLDSEGVVRAGKFFQVEFMIRDSGKYAATKNWGFARWRGTDLKPYGAGASFTGECVGCHAPLSKNDYVFTIPIKGTL